MREREGENEKGRKGRGEGEKQEGRGKWKKYLRCGKGYRRKIRGKQGNTTDGKKLEELKQGNRIIGRERREAESESRQGEKE